MPVTRPRWPQHDDMSGCKCFYSRLALKMHSHAGMLSYTHRCRPVTRGNRVLALDNRRYKDID